MTITSHTKPEVWLVHELQDALSDAPKAGKKLQLPKFQRTIVWSTDQRQELIKSLRAGHPIGALLLYELPNGSKPKTYQLVDGLQRVTAIRDYLEQPLTYLADGGLDEVILSKLTGVLSAAAGERVPESEELEVAVSHWMRETRDLRAASGFSGHKLINTVLDQLGISAPPDVRVQMYDAAGAILDLIKEQIDIGQIAVPALLFSGDSAELPDIFEKLNSAGTALSKYEIYAATWVEQETEVATPDIREAISLKYEDLEERGYEIAGLDSEGYSLFEYLFGLGKVLGQRYPSLFGAPSDSANPEGIGFSLMTVAHQVEIPNMRELPKAVRAAGAARVEPSGFEAALLDAVALVQDILRPCIDMRLNEKGDSNLVVHTQFQIASLICRVLIAKHAPFEWTVRASAVEELTTLRNSMRAHYLYDIIRGTWRSAGDRRVFARTWDRQEDGTLRPSPHYLTRLTQSELEQALDVWFDDHLQRKQRSRKHVRAVDRLFLKFVYSDRVTMFDYAEKTFELEHLFPVSRLADIVREESEGWPISAISNLALFESKLNREKSKKTISEYMKTIEGTPEYNAKKSEMDRYLLCSIDEVSIPQGEFGGDALIEDDYIAFLRERFETMKDLVLRTCGYTP